MECLQDAFNVGAGEQLALEEHTQFFWQCYLNMT